MAELHAVLAGRGLDQLSPPEVEHVLLELPAERAAYTGLLTDLAGWPDRSPLPRRIPSDKEVEQLRKRRGRWRAICLLDDESALRTAAVLFQSLYLLDPLYDSGELLYAAWHDPIIKAEHAQRLAEQAALLVRARPLLHDQTAVLAPDHLPGSWDPRPGWRRPRPTAEEHIQRAWALRTALVLLNWADRLDALVVVAREDVAAQLPIALGPAEPARCPVSVPEPEDLEAVVQSRAAVADLPHLWAAARRLCRRCTHTRLPEAACSMERIAHVAPAGLQRWTLALGEPSLPDPALLLRRVLNEQDPNRLPPLPRTPLRRRPLCLIPAEGWWPAMQS